MTLSKTKCKLVGDKVDQITKPQLTSLSTPCKLHTLNDSKLDDMCCVFTDTDSDIPQSQY